MWDLLSIIYRECSICGVRENESLVAAILTRHCKKAARVFHLPPPVLSTAPSKEVDLWRVLEKCQLIGPRQVHLFWKVNTLFKKLNFYWFSSQMANFDHFIS